jgi:hypothetical protein
MLFSEQLYGAQKNVNFDRRKRKFCEFMQFSRLIFAIRPIGETGCAVIIHVRFLLDNAGRRRTSQVPQQHLKSHPNSRILGQEAE